VAVSVTGLDSTEKHYNVLLDYEMLRHSGRGQGGVNPFHPIKFHPIKKE